MVAPELNSTVDPYSFLLGRRGLPTHGADHKETVPDDVRTPVRRQAVLKKAGIIATVATTGVLALSSFAFANEETGNLSNDCAFGNASGDAEQGQFGGSSLIGDLAGLITGLTTNAATQTNTANCSNVQLKDLIDQGSNNEDETVTETKIKDSFNEED